MSEKKPTVSTAQKWAERLRGRSRMAVATIGAVFAVGFFFASKPLGERIDAATLRLEKAEARAVLAANISELRGQSSLFQKKLPQGIDVNDWTNYLLTGFRAQRVRLSRMDPKETVSLGPCKVLAWQIDMGGDFESLSKIVEWLENGPRLVRIDKLQIISANGRLSMSMIVKGLALDVPSEKLRADREKEMMEKAKAAKAQAVKAEKHKSEPAGNWIEEKPVVIPEGMELPGGIKLPNGDALLKAADGGQK